MASSSPLEGGSFRAFARWLRRDYAPLFGHLPHRTRLHRLLLVHQRWCQHFLAQPSLFTVIDTYGIELIHPIREGRSPHQLGKKGRSNWRWIVGMKLCWVINTHGHVVAGASRTANTADQAFLPLVTALADRSIVLSDRGFHSAQGDPPNLKLCRRGEWNERMLIETAFSLLTTACGLKKVWHRTVAAFQMRLAYVAAMFNTLLTLNPTPAARHALTDSPLPTSPTSPSDPHHWLVGTIGPDSGTVTRTRGDEMTFYLLNQAMKLDELFGSGLGLRAARLGAAREWLSGDFPATPDRPGMNRAPAM